MDVGMSLSLVLRWTCFGVAWNLELQLLGWTDSWNSNVGAKWQLEIQLWNRMTVASTVLGWNGSWGYSSGVALRFLVDWPLESQYWGGATAGVVILIGSTAGLAVLLGNDSWKYSLGVDSELEVQLWGVKWLLDLQDEGSRSHSFGVSPTWEWSVLFRLGDISIS